MWGASSLQREGVGSLAGAAPAESQVQSRQHDHDARLRKMSGLGGISPKAREDSRPQSVWRMLQALLKLRIRLGDSTVEYNEDCCLGRGLRPGLGEEGL